MAIAANQKAASTRAQSGPRRHLPNQLSFWSLTFGSIGVVYGFGTSPLYAFREAVAAAVGAGTLSAQHRARRALPHCVGSIVVVAVKYVLLLLRADNNGEGGTLSLTALAARGFGRRTALVFILGVVGASMFLGDSVITPAISVLSAVEGLRLVTPSFDHYVVPVTIGILIGLFAAQAGERRG